MLPAYLMGLRPKNFKKKLPDFLKKKKTLSSLIQKLSKLNIKKTKVLVLFNYVPELNDFMFWCQQLMAESLGKNKKGFIPVISNAPKDHHSLLQLYLDGPKDKIFYVFSSKNKKNLKLNLNFFGEKTKYLNNKNYQNIKLSQKNAFIESLKKNKTPFREIIINKFDEETIGKLFLLFILETIALAQMMNVNPYDQPAVENVKILTKKFLNSEKSSKKNF
jgi:Glucose-6-phosphate isomerase